MFKKRNKISKDSVQRIKRSNALKVEEKLLKKSQAAENDLVQDVIEESLNITNKTKHNEAMDINNLTESKIDIEGGETKDLNEDSTMNLFLKSRAIQKNQIKQASNLKATILVDYQRDICKDFKQTGYCGYGDSCKFLHSRDDFKAGWKLNKDWKLTEVEKSNEEYDEELKHNKDNKTEDSKEISLKCFICKDTYKNPIATPCKHYFCRTCFLKRIKSDTTCPVCQKDTQGKAKIIHNMSNLVKR